MTVSGDKIAIKVNTKYLPKGTDKKNKFAFSYHIAINNIGNSAVQLINRYWLITDGNGRKQEVRGPGVVGKQPIINAGKSFQYTSGAILDTSVGMMEGHYEMVDDQGQSFTVPIELFSLKVPNLVN
jgi:ApaG protein